MSSAIVQFFRASSKADDHISSPEIMALVIVYQCKPTRQVLKPVDIALLGVIAVQH
ncbi:MAG: hypothetical protein I8H77_11140 [Comamonadaceae bacterium]|nr:hypothetical protein [Comamonadaceae bacterium]